MKKKSFDESIDAEKKNARIERKNKDNTFSHTYPHSVNVDDEKENVKNEESKKIKHKYYFGYSRRVFIICSMFLIFLSLTFVFFLNANNQELEYIEYKENSQLDYRVYLKKNDFYEKEYLEKNRLYVASLIDKISIDFDYNFNIDKKSDINFGYEIIAKLSILNPEDGRVYLEKEYPLLAKKTEEKRDINNYKLSEKVNINYDYYNSLANSFKIAYGINVDCVLDVYLKVNKVNVNDNFFMNDDNVMLLSIPLTEKSVDIKMDYTEIDNASHAISEKDTTVSSKMYLILGLVSLVFAFGFGVKLVRVLSLLFEKKSKYDKYIEKILKEYDRLIVETSTKPDLDNLNIIKIKRFEELLDLRDNLKLPIMYYNINKHLKSYFYINHNNNLYLMVVKAVDLDNSELK